MRMIWMEIYESIRNYWQCRSKGMRGIEFDNIEISQGQRSHCFCYSTVKAL